MITVKRLKELIEQLPDEAMVDVYEGEDVGITIELNDKYWWIRTRKDVLNRDSSYTEGFFE